MRNFALLVIIYMTAGIVWWGVLLYSKNNEYYDLQSSLMDPASQAYEDITKEQLRQSTMIIGEGLVLGISLLAGIWIIYRSALKQIETVNKQNNFLLSVSHELKSPIASIKLAMQTMRRQSLTSEQRNDLGNKVIKDAERLEKLVENILLTARMDNTKMELLKESIVLNESLEKIKEKHADNINDIRIVMDHSQTHGHKIHVDKLAFELALSNLLDNAIKYSGDGGLVSIATSMGNTSTEVSIMDEGVGIDPKDETRIFEKFYRGEHPEIKKRKGTGLGLYLSNLIVLAHGGQITWRTNTSAGVTFTVKLPRIHNV